MNLHHYSPDGLLGLAWPEIAVITTSPILFTLQKEGLTSGDFTFILSGSDPVFTLGTSEISSSQRHSTVPVTHQGFWQVDLDSVNIQGKSVTSKHSVIIDTGSTFILGDAASVQAIYASIPGSKNASDLAAGFYTCKFVFQAMYFAAFKMICPSKIHAKMPRKSLSHSAA
jgi:hypothetical protein